MWIYGRFVLFNYFFCKCMLLYGGYLLIRGNKKVRYKKSCNVVNRFAIWISWLANDLYIALSLSLSLCIGVRDRVQVCMRARVCVLPIYCSGTFSFYSLVPKVWICRKALLNSHKADNNIACVESSQSVDDSCINTLQIDTRIIKYAVCYKSVRLPNYTSNSVVKWE